MQSVTRDRGPGLRSERNLNLQSSRITRSAAQIGPPLPGGDGGAPAARVPSDSAHPGRSTPAGTEGLTRPEGRPTDGADPPPVRVFLIDDNPAFLKSAVEFLSCHAGIRVTGSATSAREGIHLVKELTPDLVLMDIAMPHVNGFQAARSIRYLPSPPKIILVTLYDNPVYRSNAAAARVDGLVTKQEFGEQIMKQIEALFPSAKK